MLQCPIDYFTENLIFTKDRSCWAVYEMPGFTYDMLSNAAKIGVLDLLTLFLSNVYSEVHISLIPMYQDVDHHFEALIAGLDPTDVLFEQAKSQAEATRAYLKAVGATTQRSNDYRAFALFKLNKSDSEELIRSLRDALTFLFHSVFSDISAIMTADSADIPEIRIREAQRTARQVLMEQRGRVLLTPVDASTIQWMLRRMTYRGTTRHIPEAPGKNGAPWTPGAETVNLAGQKFLRPRTRDVINLFSGEIYQEHRRLRIEHADAETSYQTFLAVTAQPAEQDFPGKEWIYGLQTRNVNAEIHLHVRALEHREGLKKIDNKRQQAKSQAENITGAGEAIPTDLYESLMDAEALDAELKVNRSPLLETSVVICLANTDPEQLRDAASAVREWYEDMNFVVEQPLADQLDLFLACCPGVSFTVPDFIQRLPPLTVASGIFGATRELGSRVGGYIGTTGIEGKHVFEDLRRACLSNLSACGTFYGDLGYGKSFNANLVLYLHILFGGAYGLIFDPKGERTHWPRQLPGLEGLVSLTTLSPDPQYRGTLDPFNVYRGDIDSACELAIQVLAELFSVRPKDLEYIALLDACARIKEDELPSMLRLADLLEDFPEDDDLYQPGRRLARNIRTQQKAGMAQLLFGNGSEAAIHMDNRLNILQIQNMKLPGPETRKEDYSQEEMVSSVLMAVISHFVRQFIHSHSNRFKVVLIDESWFLSKTPAGQNLIDYAARNSRSLYCSILLNGHSVLDLPTEGVRNAITYKFCFHTGSIEEAKRMLEFMRLEPTQENIYVLTHLENRQALYQDMHGRVGVVTFDAVFEDLIQVFTTTPTDAAADAELEVSRRRGQSYA